MTFKHKLSARLARLWALPVVGIFWLVSCQIPGRREIAGPGSTAVEYLLLTPPSITLATSATTDFVVVGMNAAGDTAPSQVTWSVTGGALLQTTQEGGRHYGRYRAGAQPGSYRVIAQTSTPDGARADTATVLVTAGPQAPVASVEVTPATANLSVDGTLQLTAVAKDASGAILSGRSMTWSTSNALIASVTAGLVTGVAAGTAQLAATVEGKSDTATITVIYSAVASVTVVPDVTSVAVDGDYQFSVVLKDAGGSVLKGRTVTWSSSNTAVATVNGSGMAHGVALGSATITALSEGISGSAALSVVTAPPPGQCGAWPAGITTWVQPLPVSSGQAFYAAPSGSDANPGTLAQPWKSLDKANTLQPGQILYLRAGTYGARGTTFTLSNRGTSSAPITLAGYPGDSRPIIHGRAVFSGQWLRITGLIFDGPTGDVGGPGPNGEAVLVSLSGQHTELSNSEVRHDYWHAGVGGSGTAEDYRIINNYIHDNGGYNGDYMDDQNNTSHGIYNSPSTFGLIANNVIEHNDAKGITMRHDANRIIIANNTIVGNGRYGISMVEQTANIIVANNVVMNNGNMGKGGGGISMHDTGPYTQINNVYWNNNGNTPDDNYPGTATMIKPLIANPLLVNPSDGTVPHQVQNPGTDNRLQSGSPAIGYADLNYALPFDMTGKCRGNAPDAGAYQR
jgi:hypothetical protein